MGITLVGAFGWDAHPSAQFTKNLPTPEYACCQSNRLSLIYFARVLKDLIDFFNSTIFENKFSQVGRHRITSKRDVCKSETESPESSMWNISGDELILASDSEGSPVPIFRQRRLSFGSQHLFAFCCTIDKQLEGSTV